ncbi:hypothetical protein LSTR_LSTR000882 [Laodelphax striatellus]|uniref:TOG domain-containing protein n=1 Tax=Laodelphax striatellus TaxID=195883 RepID=A0A482X2A8_LAOST|nr:hypothetical protein LSTR_LSTR000882 [Laodelphax striatellus]
MQIAVHGGKVAIVRWREDDWRGRVRSLDRLALALRQAEFSRYLATVGQRGGLALLSLLLRSLHDDRSQRLVSSSLRAARSLIQVLPVGCVHSTLACLVPSFCRHLGGGGTGSVMVKLEAIAALKSLMRIVRPAPIVDILFGDKCFGSRSSKQRESSLLCLMYSLMTFPSTEFSCPRLANWIMRAASREPKRRVRQSILETLAVLAQFVPRSQLKVDVGDYPPSERDEAAQFSDALHARLSRKLLPTVSPEGLILYAIQLPPTLIGADIEWMMRGSGSVSAGSAKNRTQLDNAQRAFNSPPQTETPSSSGSWRSQDMMAVGVAMNGGGRHLNNSMLVYPSSLDEPKSNFDVGWGDSRHSTSVNYGVVRPMYLRFQQDSNHNNTLTPDGFSHVTPSYLQSPAYASRKLLATSAPDLMNQTWPPPQQQQLQQRKSNSPGRRKVEPQTTALDGSGYYTGYAAASPPHVSINPNSLPPLVAASQEWSRAPAGYHWSLSSSSDNQVHHHHAHHHHHHTTHMNDGAQRISYDDQRQNRWTRTPSEPDVYLKKQTGSSGIGGEELTQKPVLARHYGSPQTNGPAHAGYEAYQTKTGPGSASANNRHHRAERQIQDRTRHSQHFDTQANLKRIEFAADGDEIEKTSRLRQQMRPENEKAEHVDELYGEQIIESGSDAAKEKCEEEEEQQDREANDDSGGGVDSCSSPPTPPPPPSPTPQLLPPHLHEIHPARQTPLPLDIENYLQLGSKEIVDKNSEKTDSVQNICCDGDKIATKQKITRPKIKPTFMQKGATNKGNGKLEMTTSPSLYPESLPAFDHPKEGLNKCLSHIENNDWEMTIQGMQSMIRLARHHPSLLLPHTHTLAAALSRHIRSLRSQVARASCQATALLFALLGKPLENELEDLAGSLFNRTADTNKFLRGDCTHALDCMIEHINPNKSIPAIISKGAKHQNAVVRTVASKLLAGLCAKLGAERVLSLPKQIRDSILNTGAKLLTEGSLETRKHAKELFSILSADARLPQIMADVVPNNLMRNISKTLNKLQCNNS